MVVESMESSTNVLLDPSNKKVIEVEAPEISTKEMTKIILASCCGTAIEWYDFFVFGSLTTTLAPKFYATGTDTGDVIAWLASFAIGFIVRPFGAVVFGYLGDITGRKTTFLTTILIMGVCTVLIGCLPTIKEIGPAAGVLLIILRIIQGLAIGGEYGGAATYVAEHAPHHQRGFWTSFIQITATFGLFLSLAIILMFRVPLGDATFANWGWRMPFLFSVFLLGVSVWIRVQLEESPLFKKTKSEGKLVKNPLIESFCRPQNLYYVLLSLFGATMGQGCVWYTSQFYSLFFLQTVLKVPLVDSYIIILVALMLAAPLFVVVGYYSDIYGRKPFMLAGMCFAIATYYPLYIGFYTFRYYVDAAAKPLVKYDGYNPYVLCFFVFIQVCYVALVYGPIAAFLVELFPTQIRYTSMSLPYHIGNGVFGGLVPIIGVSVTSASGNMYGGLWFPMGVTFLCLIIMATIVPETHKRVITELKISDSYDESKEKMLA